MAKSKRNRSSSLSNNGRVFILFILLLQLAAFNTGENLFYLITSAVISFLLIAWWATAKGIRRLAVRRSAPEAVHREEYFATVLRLENQHRFWPAVDILLKSEGWKESIWVSSLPAGTTAEFRTYEKMSKRGRHPLSPADIVTSFPFGLIERSVKIDDQQSVLVYPRVYSLTKSVLDEIDNSGQTPKISFNSGDEFYALRDYIPGDDIRHISWKISARMGRMIIRELEPSISRMVVLVLDTRGVPESPEHEENFEMAMDLTASLAVTLISLHYIVGLQLPDLSVDIGRGQGQSTKILEALAGAEALNEADYSDDWWRDKGQQAEASKIFLAGDPSRWGLFNVQGRARTLDPREVLHG